MHERPTASEIKRRAELTDAAVREIGAAGNLNVTVGRIAKRAGVSPGLAFHYFGDKTHLFLAAMRYVMAAYGAEVRGALATATTPRERLTAIARASFSPTNFRPDVVAAWLNFYVLAQTSPEARRLLNIYRRRLRSNLVHDLRPIVGNRAPDIGERIGGLIDGLYIRSALDPERSSGECATQHVLVSLDAEIKGQ